MPSLARDEALLVLFYAAALAVPLLTLRTAADRLAALGLLAGGMALLALATGVRLVVSDHPDELFAVGRLATPISYANAQAAMFATAAWAAVCLAARRATPLPLRALAVGGTVALVAGGLIAQSKGMIVGLVVATVVFLAACPFRLRVLVPSLLAGAVVAAGIVPLTGPFRASGAALPAAIRHAGWAVLYLSAIGVLVGVVYVLVDRRLQPRRPHARPHRPGRARRRGAGRGGRRRGVLRPRRQPGRLLRAQVAPAGDLPGRRGREQPLHVARLEPRGLLARGAPPVVWGVTSGCSTDQALSLPVLCSSVFTWSRPARPRSGHRPATGRQA